MKNKKKWIITGIIAGMLAVVAVVVIIIVRKPVAIETPIPGVKLGMDSKELKKILDKKGIEYSEYERVLKYYGVLCGITVRDSYIELFGEGTYMRFEFSDKKKKKLIEMNIDIKYSTTEEYNEHLEKVKAYCTKKNGEPKETKSGYSQYIWRKGDECMLLLEGDKRIIMRIFLQDEK